MPRLRLPDPFPGFAVPHQQGGIRGKTELECDLLMAETAFFGGFEKNDPDPVDIFADRNAMRILEEMGNIKAVEPGQLFQLGQGTIPAVFRFDDMPDGIDDVVVRLVLFRPQLLQPEIKLKFIQQHGQRQAEKSVQIRQCRLRGKPVEIIRTSFRSAASSTHFSA